MSAIPPRGGATLARPGSPEKIMVLAARVARGERPLFHPDDATGLSPGPSLLVIFDGHGRQHSPEIVGWVEEGWEGIRHVA